MKMNQFENFFIKDINDNILKITNLSLKEPLKLITIQNFRKKIYIKNCYLLCSKYNELISITNKLCTKFSNKYRQKKIINLLKSSKILIWNNKANGYNLLFNPI